MSASASSFPRKGRKAARRIALVVVVLAGIAVAGALLRGGCGPDPWRVAEARANLLRSWYDENKEANEAFRELARANGWRMYVWTNEGLYFCRGWTGIGRLDCGQSTYTSLHKSSKHRFIQAVTPFQGHRAAFIECTITWGLPWRRGKSEDFELRVLCSEGTLTKVPLPDIRYGNSIAMGNRYVVFSDQSQYPPKLWLYDIREEALRDISKPPASEGVVERLAILGDRFLLVVSSRDVLIVLNATAPYAEVSRIEGVSNMLVVGERIIIHKDGLCSLYDPESGQTDHLTPGQLVAPAGKDGFLFCRPEAFYLGYFGAALYRYDIVGRRADLFWEPPKGERGFRTEPGQGKHYDYRKLMVSPDGQFLFVPWEVPISYYTRDETVKTFEYEVYDLRSGEKRGSFLTIHEGEFYFDILGWAEADHAQTSD